MHAVGACIPLAEPEPELAELPLVAYTAGRLAPVRARLASAYRKDHLVPRDLRALAPRAVHLGLVVGVAEHAVVPRATHCE